ncbi:MASE1 domain-containing protein [Nostoc sp. FACHB-152]|uniref:MASE1 domain-containing protein n=1 Tax=unclassified Nostoc TaxID=2593658 RepID=UPI001685A1F6|nr:MULTISPECIES: MASE1 domain-containing protein [unclassified Nostoc]MBD2446419.1 MASE1 domain-containing protein [Nostoc sp. FACHB-152]MBD2469626.1 MASE1 domain-containing protein [Nostoc sp. FACHB-145]
MKWKYKLFSGRKILIASLIIPLMHFYLCKVSVSMSFENGSAAIWPSAGLFLASFLLLGYRIWPVIFFGDIIAEYVHLYPNDLLASSLISVWDTVDSLVASFLINRLIKHRNILERSGDTFKFLVLLVPTPVVGTTLAATTLCLRNITPWTAYAELWRSWFTALIGGALVVTPMLLTWFQKSGKQERLNRDKIIELALLLLSLITISRITFWQGYPVEYMIVPLLIWSAFRFGQRESTLLVVIVSAIAVFTTARGVGAFAKLGSVNQSLLLLQSFIGVVAITTFILCAVINENRKAQATLKRTNDDLEQRVQERTQQLSQALETADAAKVAADSANKAKSEFLANMSHELRTPLNGILGYAQILRRSEPLTEPGFHGIDIIYQCGSHLLTLINDVLDLSKIEAQKMELHPIEFHFPSFLEGVTEICRIRAEQKGISFIYQGDARLPVGVRADEKRLRQVLINLLGNAIKFTDKGSVVFRITSQPVVNQAQEQSAIYKIRFEVEDTGVGMAKEQVEKIFLPFEQVGDIKKQAEGTGLGLAISSKIVSLMNSQIEVQSELGKGTSFWFEVELPNVPDWAEAARLSQQGIISGYQGRKQKILVVDDKWENRSVIVNLLAPIGFELAEASNGQEGLDQAMQWQPDLIITDLIMPVMHGLELIKHLRQSPQLKNVVVLASSASVFETDQYKSLDVGANAFLPKPVQMDSLLDLLCKYLQLEWVYQEISDQAIASSPDPMLAEAIAPPALEVLNHLYQLVKKGDVYGIVDQANQMKQQDHTLVPFAQKLIHLAENFQLNPLREFIKEYLANP